MAKMCYRNGPKEKYFFFILEQIPPCSSAFKCVSGGRDSVVRIPLRESIVLSSDTEQHPGRRRALLIDIINAE